MTTSPLSFGAVMGSKLSEQFIVDTATTTGLTFGYKSGDYSFGIDEVNVSASTVALADDTTQDVLLNRSTGIISVGTSTVSTIVLYTVTTASGVITTILDRRAAYV